MKRLWWRRWWQGWERRRAERRVRRRLARGAGVRGIHLLDSVHADPGVLPPSAVVKPTTGEEP